MEQCRKNIHFSNFAISVWEWLLIHTKRDNFQRDSHNIVKLCVSVNRQNRGKPSIIGQVKQQWDTGELISSLNTVPIFSYIGTLVYRQP